MANQKNTTDMNSWADRRANLLLIPRIRLIMFWTHLRRCFGWRLSLTQPTSHETNIFDIASISSPALRSYLAWRRSQLLCSVPVLMLAAATGLSRVNRIDNRSDKGNFVLNLPNVANCVLLFAVIGAIGIPKGKLRMWTKWRMSSKIIRIGFMIAFILPIIPAIIPLRFTFKDDISAVLDIPNNITPNPDLISQAQQQNAKKIVAVGVNNFVSTLPVLISFPSSLIGGSLRIRGLLPDSTLSSWILSTTAPFLSIITLAAASLIIQFFGDATLMCGVLFKCFSPWLYVIRRGLYVKSATEEREKKADTNGKIILITNLVGLGLITTWVYTQDSLMSEKTFVYARFILEAWGRILSSTVVFSDILLRMTMSNWRIEKSICTYDLYESIEMDVRSKKSLEGDMTTNSRDAIDALAVLKQEGASSIEANTNPIENVSAEAEQVAAVDEDKNDSPESAEAEPPASDTTKSRTDDDFDGISPYNGPQEIITSEKCDAINGEGELLDRDEIRAHAAKLLLRAGQSEDESNLSHRKRRLVRVESYRQHSTSTLLLEIVDWKSRHDQLEKISAELVEEIKFQSDENEDLRQRLEKALEQKESLTTISGMQAQRDTPNRSTESPHSVKDTNETMLSLLQTRDS